MYFCDLPSDPRIVILSQTRIECSLWLTSQHTGEEPVFYYTLYVCGEGRQRCTLLPLSLLVSLLYEPLITPVAFVLALCLCVCMTVCTVCLQVGFSVSMCVCESIRLTARVYVCHAAAAAPQHPQAPC